MGSRKDERWDGTERRQAPPVLVINDEPAARELLVRFLRQAGFAAEGADTADTALAALHEHLPRCVILDMQARGVGSSLKLLDQIRTHPDQRISTARIVLCAASPKNRTFSFQSGVDAFVVRPFHLADLVAQMNDVIARPNDQRAAHRRDELARVE